MKEKDAPEDAPVFRKWIYWYVLVIAWLAVTAILFYVFTRYYS